MEINFAVCLPEMFNTYQDHQFPWEKWMSKLWEGAAATKMAKQGTVKGIILNQVVGVMTRER